MINYVGVKSRSPTFNLISCFYLVVPKLKYRFSFDYLMWKG